MKIKQLRALFICLLLLQSCSAGRLLSTWEEKSVKQYTLGEVLVIGVAKDETKRRIYEDTFSTSLRKLAVNAIPSYTASRQPIQADGKYLREVLKRTHAKSVLITHVVSENEEVFHPKQHHQTPERDTVRNYGLYDYYSVTCDSVYNSKISEHATNVVLETSIYDVQTERCIWSARSESIDPVMTRKYYQQLIALFLNDLKSKKIL